MFIYSLYALAGLVIVPLLGLKGCLVLGCVIYCLATILTDIGHILLFIAPLHVSHYLWLPVWLSSPVSDGSPLHSSSCLVSREKRFSDWYCDGSIWAECPAHYTF